MKLIIDESVTLELTEEDKSFLKENIIFHNDECITPQKCQLPEYTIYKLLELIESYGYDVDLEMYNIGRFKLIVE